MLPTKTDKARDELQGGQRTLTQRERALLLMADGRRSLTDFSPLFTTRDEAEQALLALVQRGYLQDPQAAAAAAAAAAQAAQAQAQAAAAAAPVAEPIQVSTSADSFDGKRSLATTRMFLFDMCERMFVRRDPRFALQMRDALREARDRDAMLTIAALMLSEVEKTAGPERAESLRERIDRLLPPAEIVH
ncbi:hypothetical protein SAMN05216567_114145 [Variovorax sp. OK605]|jgi:hypothetical protein|uniref:hypothetical protein n=1 Tax=unclassified Variovorax TaxID=663243 RepID=UPI0008CF7B68|nr:MULTISPECIES: hypothetical protein [unclassified Variovorax]SEK14742.1 hypothetical protein SAMN05518853_11585 [Variovorax sp. OK202]SFE03293.1 hypothetical protein SAMN05444746_11585 [Variovorax sp. OK212]SFQ36108.1 hypothetical protein SAMN05216567_114145 [Variovorax sp. OK605]